MTHTTVPVNFDLDGTLVDPAGGVADRAAAKGLECIGAGTTARHGTIVRLDTDRAEAPTTDALQTLNEVHTHGNV